MVMSKMNIIKLNKLIDVHHGLFDGYVSIKETTASGVIFETFVNNMKSTFLINKMKDGRYISSLVYGNMYNDHLCQFNIVIGSLDKIINDINVWQIKRENMFKQYTS